jgi:lipid-binding SYLF domain-containing protein
MNREERTMKTRYRVSGIKLVSLTSVVAVGLFALLTTEATPAEPVKQQALVDKAKATFQTFMADENMSWLQEHLNETKGLLIVPSLLKGGYIIGGSGGSGVLVVRDEKTGDWSQPAFYTMGSVTFGLQIGGEAAEVIMMARTQRALDSLYASSFKLGGDTSVAAGPVGIGVKSNVVADFVSFTRSKGAYAGVSLEGAVIKIRNGWNHAYYGKEVRPVDIVVKRSVINPGSAELRAALAKATEKAGAHASGPSHVVYAKTTINIRRGPGTNHAVIRQAAQGEKLEYVSLDGNWYKLKRAEGQPQEWVHKGVVVTEKPQP